MVKRLVTIPTVSLTRVVEVDGRKVGYLFFRNFVQPSVAALTDAFTALKAAGATELVLDLRYNGGGLVDVAVHLASLIGGTRTNGQVMLNYVHNDKIGPILNKTTRFANPEQALNLQRLVVITTRGSASASELVINSLRAYIPVTIIGDTTYGKPVGQYGMRFCDKILYPVAFSIKNANNEGDFFDGLPVDCAAGDDYLHQLGDTAEASFAEALTSFAPAPAAPDGGGARARGAPGPIRLPSHGLGIDPQRPVGGVCPNYLISSCTCMRCKTRIVGRRLERIRLASPFLVRSIDPPIDQANGRTSLALRRLGKRVVWDLEGDLFLVIHLMIAGRFKWAQSARLRRATAKDPRQGRPRRIRLRERDARPDRGWIQTARVVVSRARGAGAGGAQPRRPRGPVIERQGFRRGIDARESHARSARSPIRTC